VFGLHHSSPVTEDERITGTYFYIFNVAPVRVRAHCVHSLQESALSDNIVCSSR
jgi:hypothetical protein